MIILSQPNKNGALHINFSYKRLFPSSPRSLSLSIFSAMDSSNSTATVQHVNKKSSDELLRKFADENAEDRKELRLAKRRKRSSSSRRITRREGEYCESPLNNGSLVERKWLLPPAATRRSALLRQLGIGRSQLKARDVRNKSLFGTIEKTWRKTVEGASRVFIEKHYNRHKRLINDVV